MRTIYKYPLEADKIIHMPYGAQVLTVQLQKGRPMLWARVETENKLEPRRFRIVATGEEFGHVSVYIGTYQDMSYVWHVFEITEY